MPFKRYIMVHHLFLWVMASIAMLNNQRVAVKQMVIS